MQYLCNFTRQKIRAAIIEMMEYRIKARESSGLVFSYLKCIPLMQNHLFLLIKFIITKIRYHLLALSKCVVKTRPVTERGLY